ncbi:sex peptide receptor-like [Ctenocephalides felis]|uniref:sex peptide receptor-like n=1 Tax=Ctenocephalides felis TaxID=7515 RepID=UPI000E6E3EFC|nr:sex peptide receptor-like [Ctenocephalides felis]
MADNLTSGTRFEYCGPGLDSFHTFYLGLHGYFALSVCIFGCVANLLNIVILTRRELRSPTNALLTGLAVSDLLVMLDYVPFASHMYLWHGKRSREQMYEYGLAHMVFFHAIFTQICHTISIWLTVTLAVWRYIAIAHPQKNSRWCRMETTIIAIAMAYVSCPLICIPLYLAFR